MSILAPYIHFAIPALIMGVNAITNSIGNGIAAYSGLQAINRQPEAEEAISETLMLGLALMETGGIISLISCIYVFRGIAPDFLDNPYPYYAELGIAFLFLLTAIPISLVSSAPVKSACLAITRQPFFTNKIKTMMLITQTFLQAPIVFAFLLLMFIKPLLPTVTTLVHAVQISSAGLALGLGSLGPIIGLSIFTGKLCENIGINREAYKKLLFFTFTSEAIISSSIVFSLVLALFILKLPHTPLHEALNGIPFFAAALALGLSTFSVGISSGKISAAASTEIAHNVELSSDIFKMSFLAQALIETSTLYGLVVAFMILLM